MDFYREQEQKMISPIESIAAWYQTPIGARIGRDLIQCLAQHAEDAFGYHAVVMGASLPLGARLRIRHVTQVSPSLAAMGGPSPGAGNEYPSTSMLADFTALPIAGESADLVIALHVLENLRQPHELLREMDRIVRPEGRLLIVGVNPVSLLPISRLLGRTCYSPLLRGHRHAAWRLVDWLRVLGYEINAVEHLGGLCPTCRVRRYERFRRVREWSRHWAWFLHGFYVIDATRRESTPTAIRPAFRLRELMPQKAGSQVASSTTAGARLKTHINRN